MSWEGYSLVEKGKQVARHHQGRPRDAQQDLTDALCSLVHVFNPCGEKCAWDGHYRVEHHEYESKTKKEAETHNLWASIRMDSRTQEMRSLNLSFGNKGFSKPLKYSFSTPATELMSWLFSSSISGSLPGHHTGEASSPGTFNSELFTVPVHLSPLSKEFLMSLTSTCDPDTRNIPWCCRPVRNQTGVGDVMLG